MKQTSLREQWQQAIERRKAEKLKETKFEELPRNEKKIEPMENKEIAKPVRKRKKRILDDED